MDKSINEEILEVLCTKKCDLQKIINGNTHSVTAEKVARFLYSDSMPNYKTINAITNLIKSVNNVDIIPDSVLRLEVLNVRQP